MKSSICPRCESRFFSAATVQKLNCPFCGFEIRIKSTDRKREEARASINRNCLLAKGHLRIPATVVDISSKGAGVVVSGPVTFGMNDRLDIQIKDFEINTSAEVKWVKNMNNDMYKAGLRFYKPNA